MVTHDLDSLFSVCDRVAVLGNKKVLVEGTDRGHARQRGALGEILFPRQAGAAARSCGARLIELKRAQMETRANYVIVGIFTLVAIVAAFAFVYWTAAIGDRGETALAARAHSGLGVRPRPRQRGAVQRRQGRRRAAGLHRRAQPDGRHRRYRDRPADADHQVDPGRYRHCRAHRTGKHRAQGRRSEGSQPARRGRARTGASPKSPPIHRR